MPGLRGERDKPAKDSQLPMGIASDDGITVEVNRAQVFNISIPRGFARDIQNRFPVTLLPGGNLIQFKTFEGGGGWGLRARFEDPLACAPVLSGEGEIEVGIEPIPLVTLPGTSTRTIVTTGNTQADITVATTAGGASYSLRETLAPADREHLHGRRVAARTAHVEEHHSANVS